MPGGPGAAGVEGLAQTVDPAFLTQVITQFGANIAALSTSLDRFNQQLSSNINELKNLKFQVKLETTNVNVNFSGTNFLNQLSASIKQEILHEVATQMIPQIAQNNNGNFSVGGGVIG